MNSKKKGQYQRSLWQSVANLIAHFDLLPHTLITHAAARTIKNGALTIYPGAGINLSKKTKQLKTHTCLANTADELRELVDATFHYIKK